MYFETEGPITNISKQEPVAPVSLWCRFRQLLGDIRVTFRQGGFRGVVQRYGWKLFAAFFIYYLIRDVTLYIIIPYLVAKHLMS